MKTTTRTVRGGWRLYGAVFLLGVATAALVDLEVSRVQARDPDGPTTGTETEVASLFDGSTAQPLGLRTHRLSELNWMEVSDLVPDAIDRVILPVGSVEAHGVLNNAADTVVQEGLSDLLAPRLNALVAPAIPYGIPSPYGMFPGSLQIDEEAFEAYVGSVLTALAEEGFENIIVLNGHAPNRPVLDRLALDISTSTKVRTLVVDWWQCCDDVTRQVYDTEGGHAGVDETALVLALEPEHVRQDLYHEHMAQSSPDGCTVYPVPSSIQVGDTEGRPDFDPDRSRAYLHGVVDKMTSVIGGVLQSWDEVGL